jgi:putative SOS response-associated peptidase YedK
MCGRFSLAGDVDFYADYFGVDLIATDPLEPSWNVAPTDRVYVVVEREGLRTLEQMRWGFIPHWSAVGRNPHINARRETVATTPAFRDSLARKRCLIPADGFYEWEPSGRRPHWLFRADGYPVGFAGIWSTWRQPSTGTLVRSCAIVTGPARGVVAPLHHRMPQALDPAAWGGWLDRSLTAGEQALAGLRTIGDDLWMARPVSTLVNSVRNNGPALQDPDRQGRLL